MTRNMQAFMDQMEVKFNELKISLNEDLKISSADLKQGLLHEIKSYIDEQCQTIKVLNENIIRHESTIAVLQNTVNALKEDNLNLKNKFESELNELEQYGRRQSLRIDGVKVKDSFEDPEDVVQLVHGYMQEVGIKATDMVIDRAHRVGPIYENEKNEKCRSIITKFNNFRIRSLLYKGRKNKNLKDKVKIRIDLTKKKLQFIEKC